MRKDVLRFSVTVVFSLVALVLLAHTPAAQACTPCIDVVKECRDANSPGEPIPFEGYVTNCGDVSLYNITAEDDMTGLLDLDYTTLDPGQSVYFSGSYYPDTSPSTNTVTAAGESPDGTVSDSDTATCSVPEEIGCRVTGGGNDTAGVFFDGSYDGTFAEGRSRNSNGPLNRYTFGGQAGAFTAQQPQPYGEWTHHQQSGPSGRFVFHAGTASAPPGTEIDEIVCSDPGGCRPSGDPPSPAKQIDFSGIGTFKNIESEDPNLMYVIAGETYHWFEVHIEDLGEPGRGNSGYNDNGCPEEGSGTDAFADPPDFVSPAMCDCPDFYRIRIFEAFDPTFEDPDMINVIYEVYGYINGGNLQIHYPTGYDQNQ